MVSYLVNDTSPYFVSVCVIVFCPFASAFFIIGLMLKSKHVDR
jgi:hypothetical protein